MIPQSGTGRMEGWPEKWMKRRVRAIPQIGTGVAIFPIQLTEQA
ncbi:hypothetical protein ACFL7D_11860 [candidate division KSB1 bacterium]